MSNPYGYEMNDLKGSDQNDFVGFMNEIQDINNQLDQYGNLISLISNKQRNLIQEIELNTEDSEYNSRQVDSLIGEAKTLQDNLKSRISSMQVSSVHKNEKARIDQIENCRQRFLEEIQEYRIIENQNREQTKLQAERQYKIIKPDASEQEIRAVVEDGSDSQQYFQQALMQSNRRGEARTVLNEVQTRHRELLKLERTMAELTQLFHDMEELVIEQDQAIQQIDEQVATAQHDIEQGVGHTNKAVISAKKARKKRLWCFLICLIIVAILAVVLGAYFGTR
ncbi:protein Sso1p [[Candida] jaroonii]|uniref:Protein Sso1p n=1 Tax=[Candida] jaroonii TaxID=467808 RepID=A0ACA9Y0A8_9ASCO|nr:protein Sso1p [[Candida] jaroonii]